MRLYLDRDQIVLDFPFDRDQVEELKLISGAKWDKLARVWTVPITSIEEARQFAIKHNFDVTIDAMKFTVPPPISRTSRVFIKNGMIFMRFAYERVIIKEVKKIPAVTWDSKEYSWKAPLASIQSVIEWARAFDVPVDNDVNEAAAGVMAQLSEFIDASRSTDAEVEIPALQGELLPYQKAGVVYATRAKRSFIADQMGLGKTIQAICSVEYASTSAATYPAVVVCPPSLVLNWKSEWNRWLPERRVATVTNRKEFPDKGSYDVVVVGYSNITHWEKSLLNHASYIFDESHYAKSPAAKRTKSAIKIAKTAGDGLVLCLTGTPVTNRPNEYASQLDILGRLKDFGGLWGFYRRYCGAFQDRFGQWNISGHSHLDELNDRLRGTCYIRRTKDQVLSELPPVIHSKLMVEGDSVIMNEYRKAEADIVQYIAERARQLAIEQGKPSYGAAVAAMIRAEANEHLVRLSVLRRIAARAKMALVHEWVDDMILYGRKVVIAAHHRDIVDELARKYGGLKIQGGMAVEDVEEHKRKFQTLSVEEAPVIVLSIQAAKTGHTLTAAENILFVELPWTPADVDQTYSRLHRIGQKGSVTATYMTAFDTIDEDIYSLIERKRAVVDAAVDGGEMAEFDSATQLILDLIARQS